MLRHQSLLVPVALIFDPSGVGKFEHLAIFHGSAAGIFHWRRRERVESLLRRRQGPRTILERSSEVIAPSVTISSRAALASSNRGVKPDDPSSASAGKTTTSRPPGRSSFARRSEKGFPILRGLAVEFSTHLARAVCGEEVAGNKPRDPAEPHRGIGGPCEMDWRRSCSRRARCILPTERNDMADETNPIECSFAKRDDAGRRPSEKGRPGY